MLVHTVGKRRVSVVCGPVKDWRLLVKTCVRGGRGRWRGCCGC